MAKAAPQQYQVTQGYIDTVGIGGDRFGFLPTSSFNPQAFVGSSNPVPLALLSVPPTYQQLGTVAASYPTGATTMSMMAAHPWHPKWSPNVWVILALIFSVWAIHTLYYKEKRKEEK